MKLLHVGGLLATLVLAGCDTINERHLCISTGESSAGAHEKVAVALATVAGQLHMTEMTSQSTAPNTIAFYTLAPKGPAPNGFFLVELGARAFGDEIAVDLHAPFGPAPQAFSAADELLAPALVKSFGANLRLGTCAAGGNRR